MSDSNIPFISDDGDTSDNTSFTTRAKGLIPWLPDPFECPKCNTHCQHSTAYDPLQAAFHGGESPAWECPECGSAYRRDNNDNLSADMW